MRMLWLTWKDCSHPFSGGAEVVNEEIAKRLAARGWEIVFLVGNFPGGAEYEERDGYRIERMGNRFTCYFQAWRRYRSAYRGWADVVIDEINTVPFFAGWYVNKQAAISDQRSEKNNGEEGRGDREENSEKEERKISNFKFHPPRRTSDGQAAISNPAYASLRTGAQRSEKADVTVSFPDQGKVDGNPERSEGEARRKGLDQSNPLALLNRVQDKLFTKGDISPERVFLFVHQLCREIWFYQLPWFVAWIGYVLEPLYLRLLSRFPVITVSESTKRDLMRYGFVEENVCIMREGTTTGEWKSQIQNPKSQVPPTPLHKESEMTLLVFGAMRAMKRTRDAVRAFEIAKERMPDLKLIVAGDAHGSYGQGTLRMMERSGYAADIAYEGAVDEARKVELMRSAHLLLSCAVKEGWGLTVTEANAQGTPAVVYDSDGLRDSVRHGETGIVCARNPQAMADAIVRLLGDETEYERLRTNAWEWAKTFTFERMAEEFELGMRG